ncbi:MAG: RAMP superfamily protein [Deltaproteobacteria bacterium ADurb.BinA179]|jgi:CRISPR-associated protein Csm3|nr:MAG: RAMP superfamily protein [Deltaproteobacteria bacterium ADurb.BinA179]HOD70753.1 type III-A CRISPR-associated RAMP protein Csm3 [Deltaproteobacteria bacterium]HQM20939.1 type III-A CRISPR-associated RAMP protein Csm3 [Deltaproteobacteria bacterium]HRC99181.1 type III-A CRISPR-associated RAMP protein Csm3 [Deltaproteobacteria bacterium]
MKLTKIYEIKGQMKLISGLHIGAGDTEMHIGGTDNPIIKHPHSQEPYIPGSSIKGKVRSLLEMKSGLMIQTGGKPVQASLLKNLQGAQKGEAEKIIKLFGSGGDAGEEIVKLGPTRASFADCPLNNDSRTLVREKRLTLTEVKSENSINRIKGTAENPRFSERVPAGMVFDFSVTLKQLSDEDKELLDYLLAGLKLLTMDALGGSGSRGYGRISLTLSDPDMQRKFETVAAF